MTAPPRWVEHYLAIPFVDRGRTERGCDCFGLVRLVLARQGGIIMPDYGFVPMRDRGAINAAIDGEKANAGLWRAVPLSQAQPLDVVPMTDVVTRQDGSSDVAECHVGIMVSTTRVLHTEIASGPVCVDVAHRSVAYRFSPQDKPLVYRHRDLCK